MNEKIWHEIFKKYIDCYEATQTLKKHFVIDDDLEQEMKVQLLGDIIATFKGEVE